MKKGQHKYEYNRGVFDNISTKEQAYWHGLISADGYINIETGCFGLNMSVKDEILGDRFIEFLGLPKHLKKYRSKKRDRYHCKNREYKYFSIVVYSKELISGFLKYLNISSNNKAKRLCLPEFNDESLNMAWLIGYYDGDGSEKSPRISSSSLKLLEQIKERYSIPFKITKVKGKCLYVLYIGEYLREKLCCNYDKSLERKRVQIIGRKHRGRNNNLNSLTEDILKSLVNTHSLSEIGIMFGVNRSSVFAKIKRLKIKVPKRKGGRKLSRFFLRKECKFYPCHQQLGSCNLCFCPLYNYDCGGDFIILDNGCKDCSECLLPHGENGYDYVIEFLKNRMRK